MLGTWCWIDPPQDTVEIVIFDMCHQLASSGTSARFLDLISPLFLTMCSCALWDFKIVLRN
jgi:hypothetical protein